MKLHDNSRFRGELVVLVPGANLLEPHRLIEDSSSLVGFPDLQENPLATEIQQWFQQLASDPPAPQRGRHYQVQHFTFALGQPAPNQKAGDTAARNRHRKLIL